MSSVACFVVLVVDFTRLNDYFHEVRVFLSHFNPRSTKQPEHANQGMIILQPKVIMQMGTKKFPFSLSTLSPFGALGEIDIAKPSETLAPAGVSSHACTCHVCRQPCSKRCACGSFGCRTNLSTESGRMEVWGRVYSNIHPRRV